MYDLSNFIEYDGSVRDGEHKVLVWSKQTGYYFSQFGFVPIGILIVAKEK